MSKKSIIFIIIVIAAVAYGSYQSERMAENGLEENSQEVVVVDEIADWQSYTNEEHGYSFNYPQDCIFGSLPGACKQSPPEERESDCLCYLNGQDANMVSLQTFTGTKPDLSGVNFQVFHSIYADYYNPPEGTEIAAWVNQHFLYDEIPSEPNTEVAGLSAVKVYTPFSGMAWSQEDIYFIKDNKLFQISMLDVDNEENRALYDNILASFSFSE